MLFKRIRPKFLHCLMILGPLALNVLGARILREIPEQDKIDWFLEWERGTEGSDQWGRMQVEKLARMQSIAELLEPEARKRVDDCRSLATWMLLDLYRGNFDESDRRLGDEIMAEAMLALTEELR